MLRYLRKNMRTIIIIVAALFAASMFYGLGYRGFKREGRREGIAKVNGKPIDILRFNQVLEGLYNSIPGRKKPQQLAYLQILALNQVIDYTLMLEDAKSKRIKASRDEVDGAIKQIMAANKIADVKTFKDVLKSKGLDFGTFKNIISNDIVLQKMTEGIKSGVTVKPEDMREVWARHILIRPKVEIKENEKYEEAKARADEEAKKKALELLQRIKKGENFESVAKEYSSDKVSAAAGGDLGYFKIGTMVPEFEEIAFSLKPGEVSDIVKTEFGYHIIKVEDTRLRKVKEGEELKKVILKEKQDRALSEWMRDLKEKAKIEIVHPMFKGHDLRMKGKQTEAIAEYRKAIAENPPNAYLYLLTGDTYLEMGEIKLAISEYKQAVVINASEPDIFITLGKAYEMAMEKFPEEKDKYRESALEEYRQASVLAASDKSLHEELMGIFKNLGAIKDERAEKQKIAEIEKKEEFEKKLREEMETKD